MHVIIHGRDMSLIDFGASTPREANDYVARIVYGDPVITAVKIGNTGRFVAVVDYGSDGQTAKHTFDRMGSFSHGAQLCGDRAIALREFGAWIFHYTPTYVSPSHV